MKRVRSGLLWYELPWVTFALGFLLSGLSLALMVAKVLPWWSYNIIFMVGAGVAMLCTPARYIK